MRPAASAHSFRRGWGAFGVVMWSFPAKIASRRSGGALLEAHASPDYHSPSSPLNVGLKSSCDIDAHHRVHIGAAAGAQPDTEAGIGSGSTLRAGVPGSSVVHEARQPETQHLSQILEHGPAVLDQE